LWHVVWWLDSNISKDCTASVFRVEDGGSTVLQNVGLQPPHYMLQQPRKPQILSSQPWKPWIFHVEVAIVTESHKDLARSLKWKVRVETCFNL